MYSHTSFNTISHFTELCYYTLLKYPLIKFFHNFIFFLFVKQGKSIAISLATLARLSIFLKQKRNSLTLKQSFSFQKNHDILY